MVQMDLGCGANQGKVLRWPGEGAGAPGYAGFAVGRTLWWAELVPVVAGELTGAEASTAIALNYRELVACARPARP